MARLPGFRPAEAGVRVERASNPRFCLELCRAADSGEVAGCVTACTSSLAMLRSWPPFPPYPQVGYGDVMHEAWWMFLTRSSSTSCCHHHRCGTTIRMWGRSTPEQLQRPLDLRRRGEAKRLTTRRRPRRDRHPTRWLRCACQPLRAMRLARHRANCEHFIDAQSRRQHTRVEIAAKKVNADLRTTSRCSEDDDGRGFNTLKSVIGRRYPAEELRAAQLTWTES